MWFRARKCAAATRSDRSWQRHDHALRTPFALQCGSGPGSAPRRRDQIDHGNGMTTRYGHLSRFNVVPGQEVRRGDVIAFSGATGRVTAPHLHYEVRMGGAAVNPHPYLTRSATVPSGKSDLPF